MTLDPRARFENLLKSVVLILAKDFFLLLLLRAAPDAALAFLRRRQARDRLAGSATVPL